MSATKDMILEAFQFRHACKKFDPSKQVSDEDIRTILEVGRLSPSSFGFEPWKFLIVQNTALKKKLYPVAWGAQNSIDGASHLLIILARRKVDMIYSSPYIMRMLKDIHHIPDAMAETRRKGYENFQIHDFELLESDRAMFDWACKQTYIALGNMLTTAALLGIDSCPIEGFNRSAVDELLGQEQLIDLDHFGVSVMAGFGYRSKNPRGKTRQAMDDTVQWIK